MCKKLIILSKGARGKLVCAGNFTGKIPFALLCVARRQQYPIYAYLEPHKSPHVVTFFFSLIREGSGANQTLPHYLG